MTLLVRIPGRFTNPQDLPEYRVDPILTDGSLILWEPSHPAALLQGVPANGDLLTNLANYKAAELLPEGADTRLPMVVQADAAPYLKRTAKGGLWKQYQSPGLNRRAAVRWPQAIVDYIFANPTHRYYVGIWYNFQSPMTVGGRPVELTDKNNSRTSPNNALAFAQVTVVAPGGHRLSRDGLPSFTGERNAASAQSVSRIFGEDTGSSEVTNYLPAGAAPHMAAYRVYVEDLTVSGRTASAVDTIDAAEYTTHVTTSGGRYYADTFPTPI